MEAKIPRSSKTGPNPLVFLVLVLLQRDCGHRGWCDSPQSVLSPSYEARPIVPNPRYVLFLVCE